MGIKQLLNLGDSGVLGLDIGFSSVKMIGLRKDAQGYSVTAAAVANISSSGSSSNLIRKSSAVRAIQECIAHTSARTKLVVCGLSGTEVVVRDFSFHAMPADEIFGAVELEASQVCPYNIADSTVDYQLMSSNDENISGILVASPNNLINTKLQITKDARLDCAMIDVDGLALLNCFKEFEKPDPGQTIVILNIGGMHATLVIMDENGWPSVRDLTYAGNAIMNQVASESNIPLVEVNRIFTEGSVDEKAQLRPSLDKACRGMVEDIKTTSRFYKTQHKTANFEQMHICGGFSMVEGFVDLLNAQLSFDVMAWNPFDRISRDASFSQYPDDGEDLLKTKGPVLAVAAGLALRSI